MSGTQAPAGAAHLSDSSVLQWPHADDAKQKQAGPGHGGRSSERPLRSGTKLSDSPKDVSTEARPGLDSGQGARLMDYRQVTSEEVRQAERML